MNDFVERLISLLEPTIVDLDSKLDELSNNKNLLEKINAFLNFVDTDIKKIGLYENQQLIINDLTNLGSNENEYKASCYLLNSENDNVKNLPQYHKAYEFIEKIINYFKLRQDEISIKVNDLEKECHEKEVNKKYLKILESANPFIDDVEEFALFIKDKQVIDEDKIKIMNYIIQNNVKEYKERVKGR